MAAVCKAFKPPANNNTDAITPSVIAQNILWFLGGSWSPPAVSISITKLPESDDVTKNVTISNVDKVAVIWSQGRYPRVLKSEVLKFAETAAEIGTP